MWPFDQRVVSKIRLVLSHIGEFGFWNYCRFLSISIVLVLLLKHAALCMLD